MARSDSLKCTRCSTFERYPGEVSNIVIFSTHLSIHCISAHYYYFFVRSIDNLTYTANHKPMWGWRGRRSAQHTSVAQPRTQAQGENALTTSCARGVLGVDATNEVPSFVGLPNPCHKWWTFPNLYRFWSFRFEALDPACLHGSDGTGQILFTRRNRQSCKFRHGSNFQIRPVNGVLSISSILKTLTPFLTLHLDTNQK